METVMKQTTYTIKKIRDAADVDRNLLLFIVNAIENSGELYDDHFNFKNFDIGTYIKRGLFWVCYKNDAVQGVMLGRIYKALFDPKVKILKQELLYVKSPGHRAAYLLLKEFIDFGKSNANDIITMIGEKTNIKGKSLERLGFKKLEVIYRMEV